MIDVTVCELEDVFYDGECMCHVAFFVYPKEDGEAILGCPEYENVVCYCIKIIVHEDGTEELAISPTVEDDYGLHDVDWCDLYDGEDYNQETVNALRMKANI